MSPALRAAYLAARQAEGGAEYATRKEAEGIVAENPAHGFRISFSEEGVALAGAGAPRAMLRPARFGCAGALREVGSARPEVRAGRVEFPRESFVEWYVNGPLGLEQGFSVAEAPHCGDAKGAEGEAVEVELALGEGLSASLEKGGDQLALRDDEGRRVLGVSELVAVDALGAVLPSRLGVSGAHRISMRVETAGAVYPVVIDPLVWKEEQKLIANDGAESDEFGFSIALSGDTALVGAPWSDTNGQTAGAAYIFVRQGSAWAQQQKLLPSDGAAGDRFGISVALSGDTALVGADLSDAEQQDAGAVYVFLRSGSFWIQQQKLLAEDGTTLANFGCSVALSGDTALVGAPWSDTKGHDAGAAYVFVQQGSSWTQQQILFASDASPSDGFGGSVALSGDTALVGASWSDAKGHYAGAAYVFARQGSSWIQQDQLLAEDGAASDHFGSSVALSGDTALVGALYNQEKGPYAGAAYVFLRSGSSWIQQDKLLAEDGAASDEFGASVALSGDTALIGALGSPARGPLAGAAYVFLRSGSSWIQQDKLLASNGGPGDEFGISIALSADSALVGAPYNSAKGSAYSFVLPGPCSKDADCPTPPPESCALAFCIPQTTVCGTQPKLDGAPCPSGVCREGACAANPSSSTGSTGTGGVGGVGGSSSSPADSGNEGGCACATRRSPRRDTFGLLLTLLLALMPHARRRRRHPT